MTKDTDKAVSFWLMSSKDNLETAHAMLKADDITLQCSCVSNPWRVLKGGFYNPENDRPEYIHKLSRLVELTGFEVLKRLTGRSKIDAHYIKARYKEDRFNKKIYNRRNAAQLLKDAQDVIVWFTKKLKLKA